jgi:PBSX family phage terminase large subunit
VKIPKKKTKRKVNEKSLANLKPFKPGFDPNRNLKGAPPRGQDWRETLKRITEYTREEAIEYVGANTTIGRMLKELPPNIPIKDGMAFQTVIAYGREPSARMLTAIMDRVDGKPTEGDKEAGSNNQQAFTIPADLVAPDMLASYRALRSGQYTEFLEYGGRGSTKSSFISLAIIYLIINNPDLHALIARQVGATLRDSVYAQIQWAINELGLSDKFKMTTSPMEITYLPTDQKIYFRGLDDAGKIKSITPVKGYIGIFWLEEADQAKGAESVRKVEQSLRGGDVMYFFKSWNPPRTQQNWINKYSKIPKERQWKHTSDYRTVPKEWLGQTFIDEAEHLKNVNPKAYDNEYLGIVTGTGGTVFENALLREITDKEIEAFDRMYNGLDWGYAVDPAHYSKMYYNSGSRTLYIFGEVRKWKTSNEQLYKDIKETKLYDGTELLIPDSAEPKSIADFRKYGANVRGAEKGADSVRYSMRWLENLTQIVIDPKRCPYTAEEFIAYEYEQNKDGEYISEYPDRNNHAIDSVRYALNLQWRRMGE